MSGPAGVLAVLDREIDAIIKTKDIVDFSLSVDRQAAYAGHLSSLREARAAVAELVEAVTEKFAADDDKHERGYRTVGMDLRSMAADDRLRAALANIGSAK